MGVMAASLATSASAAPVGPWALSEFLDAVEKDSVERVTFEAAHLPDATFMRLGNMLRGAGFELVFGGFKAPLSTWHHVNASA